MWKLAKFPVTACGIQPLKFKMPRACLWSSNVPSPKHRCIPWERRGPHIDLRLISTMGWGNEKAR